MVVFFANVLVLFSIAFLTWKKETGNLRLYFWPALLFRMTAGIFIGLLYTFYYGHGDTLDYFTQAKLLTAFAAEDFGAYLQFLISGELPAAGLEALAGYPPRALFFSRWVSLVAMVTGNNYWLTSCFFSMVSFLSSWYLVKQLVRMFPALKLHIIVALQFFPSVVLWSSGVIKESLALAALFFTVTVFLKIWNRERPALSHWVVLIPSVWVLWYLKYYFAAILLPVLFTELIMKRLIVSRYQMKMVMHCATWLVLFIVPVAVISTLHPNLNLNRVLEVVVTNHDLFVTMSDPTELVGYQALQPELGSVLKNAPRALSAGLFRPFVWEVSNPLQLLAAIENLVVLILTIGLVVSLVRRRWNFSGLWFAAVCYSLMLCLLLALATPNLGTLSRYKVGFLPFLLLVLSSPNLLIDKLLGIFERKGTQFVE